MRTVIRACPSIGYFRAHLHSPGLGCPRGAARLHVDLDVVLARSSRTTIDSLGSPSHLRDSVLVVRPVCRIGLGVIASESGQRRLLQGFWRDLMTTMRSDIALVARWCGASYSSNDMPRLAADSFILQHPACGWPPRSEAGGAHEASLP
jgi:hypothetical protein